MRSLTREGIRSPRGKKAKQKGNINKKKSSFKHNELVNWKLCKNVFFLALLFDCYPLAKCEPQTMRKVTQKPGFYAQSTITYDGPNAPSIFDKLKSDGFSRVEPGQEKPFIGLDSLLRKTKTQGTKRPFGFGSPPEYRRQESDSSSSPFSDMKNWRKQTLKRFNNMRKSMFQAMNNRQGLGGMSRRPTRVIGFGSDDSDGDSPKMGGWAPLGGNSATKKPRNEGWTEAPKKSGSGNFHRENLDAHNEYRKKHGMPPLKLNDEISQVSQRWAEHLANRGSIYGIYHSDRNFRKGYGENIHASYGMRETGRTAVDSWYSEIKDYDFKTGTSINGNKIGHLTQLLWDTSQELGVGYAFSKDGSIFVVCHYNPPGNYVGQNTKHVPPIGGFSAEDLKKQAEDDTRRRQTMFRPTQSFFDRF